MRHILFLVALATVAVLVTMGTAQAALFTDFESPLYTIGEPFVDTEAGDGSYWPSVDNWSGTETYAWHPAGGYSFNNRITALGVGDGNFPGPGQLGMDEGHNAGNKSGRFTRGGDIVRHFEHSDETITDFESINMLVNLRANRVSAGLGGLKMRGNLGTTNSHDFFQLRAGTESRPGISWMWMQNHDNPLGGTTVDPDVTTLFVYQDGGEGNRGWVDTEIHGWGYQSDEVSYSFVTDEATGINKQLSTLEIDIDWDNSQVTFNVTHTEDGVFESQHSTGPIDVNLAFQPTGEDPPAATYEEELIANGHLHMNGINATDQAGFLTIDDIYVMGAAGLPGDFDEDGDVDGGDFLLWQTDMSVGDLADWTANFGNTSAAPTAAAVPEPASILLLLAGTFCCIGRRARR